MAVEQKEFPPENVEYVFLDYKTKASKVMKSPMKGFMCEYYDQDVDVVEAVLTPAKTKKDWFYSLACFEEAVAFSFFGIPIPRVMRTLYMNWLFTRKNFKGLLFWSEAGRNTLFSYGKVKNKKVIDKSYVIYPAIRVAPDSDIRYTEGDSVRLLFNGNFFIKGGANVVDVFEMLQKEHPNISLHLCCDVDIDFFTDDNEMREDYLNRISKNSAITMWRVPREEFTGELLPNTDVYVLPTYGDAFGFAILEAMSYGVPVISTNYMAIPEMIEHGVNGLLIDVSPYECQKMFKGCYVRALPNDFREHINAQLYEYLKALIGSPQMRKDLGQAGVSVCKRKFSFASRRDRISQVYSLALGGPHNE